MGGVMGTQIRTVGFIGLGIMGAPMAANLVRAGFDVVGHNRSPARQEALVSAGGRAAASAAEAAGQADAVITMLPDSPDVQAVLLGEDGVFASARPGTLVIDMSTIRPDVARAVAAAGAERGLRVLDAPVSGGEAGADRGHAVDHGRRQRRGLRGRPAAVRGDGPDHRARRPGRQRADRQGGQPADRGRHHRAGRRGHRVPARPAACRPGPRCRCWPAAWPGNRILDRKAAGMVERQFTPGFRAELHDKDLGIVLATARSAGVILPLGAAVGQLMGSLKAQGLGGLDHTALLRIVEQLSGRSPE